MGSTSAVAAMARPSLASIAANRLAIEVSGAPFHVRNRRNSRLTRCHRPGWRSRLMTIMTSILSRPGPNASIPPPGTMLVTARIVRKPNLRSRPVVLSTFNFSRAVIRNPTLPHCASCERRPDRRDPTGSLRCRPSWATIGSREESHQIDRRARGWQGLPSNCQGRS